MKHREPEYAPRSLDLVNGIRPSGRIESFGAHVALREHVVTRMVHNHVISTVVAARMVNHAAPASVGLVQ